MAAYNKIDQEFVAKKRAYAAASPKGGLLR
jgi:hypothetical protein